MSAVKARKPPLELGAAPEAFEAVRQFQRCREIAWLHEGRAVQYAEGSQAWDREIARAQRYRARAELWLQLLESWLEKEVKCQ